MFDVDASRASRMDKGKERLCLKQDMRREKQGNTHDYWGVEGRTKAGRENQSSYGLAWGKAQVTGGCR